MKSKTEIDTHIIGYPCYKCILRSMESKTAIPEFEKVLFGIAKMDELSNEEMVKLLSDLKDAYLYEGCAVFGADFFTYHEKGASKNALPTFVLSAKSIKYHTQCSAYYKSFQSNQNACLACTRSVLYANRYLKEELSLLRFLLKDKESYQYLTGRIKEREMSFLSVFDVLYDFRAKKSCYIPLNALLYSCLIKESFDPDKPYTGQMEAIKEGFLSGMLKTRLVPGEYSMRPGWVDAVLNRHLDRIMEQEEITIEEADRLLMLICAYQKEREEKKALERTLDGSKKSTYIDYKSRDERPKNQVVLSVTDILSMPEDNTPLVEVANKVEEIESPPELEEAFKPLEDVLSASSKVADTPDSPEPCENQHPKNNFILLEDSPEEVKSDVPNGAEYYLSICCQNNHLLTIEHQNASRRQLDELGYEELPCPAALDCHMVMERTLTAEQLNYFRPINDDLLILANLEDAAMRDKMIAAEVVGAENGFVLLLYTASRHLFLQYNPDAPKEKETVARILRRPGIKKICYQPYLLYAYCYSSGLKVKGVTSLWMHYRLVYPNSPYWGLRDLLIFASGEEEPFIKEKLKNSKNLLFDSMRYYKRTYLALKRKEALIPKTTIEGMEQLDLAFGYSYLLSGCMKNKKRLFTIDDKLTYRFHNTAYLETKNDVLFSGYFATYEIPFSTKHATSILTRFLCNMSKEGYFSESNIQIVYFTKNRVVFFIAEREFAFLDSVISTLLRSQMKQHGCKDTLITVLYEYHQAEKNDP